MRVLLIEDNEVDVELTLEALGNNGTGPVAVARDGAEAMELLRGVAEDEARPPPDLVLLDLRLPGVSGHDVLAFMKGHDRLKSIPVVVVSSSENPDDLTRAYRNRANCYVVKPVGVDDFIETMQSVARFWLRVAELPARP